MTLQEIWDRLPVKTDKGDIHDYLPVYEEILALYRETAKNILEIGLLSGASMLMWEQYFTGTVYGIDCDIKPIGGRFDLQPMIDEGTHNIIIGDAEEPAVLEKHFIGIKFDVIIEDANHQIAQQLNLYNRFKPYLNKGAIYIIEDIQEIDSHRFVYEMMDKEKTVEIIDLRKNKGRYDDVLIVIK